ncbi:MAG: phage tail tape measure protein [Halodesulfovibrio sp.]|uniref:phage tail tape measure protein n=1 Tax=Halodesulfovibrio sp. TaxID=1912772 RepID=UPI00359ECC09
MSTVSTRIVISAKDTATGVFRRTGMQVENLKRKVFSLNSAVAGLGLGLGGMEMYQQARDFETALTDMSKVTTRDLGLIRTEIMSLPPELGNATELMRGYYQVISSGVTDPAKAMDVLVTSAKSAKAAHTAQDDVVKALTKTMAGFGGEVKSAAEASDLLFSIEKVGQTSFAELVPVVGDLSTLSHALGLNTAELGGALAHVTQTAGSTSQAATQYKAVLMGLYKPTENMQKLLTKMGYTSGKALVADKGFVGALRAVKEESEKSGIALGKVFESSEALIGLNALFSNSFETLTSNIAAVEQGVGGSNAAWKRWLTTSQAMEEALKNQLGNTLVDLGTELLPLVKSGMTDLTTWVGQNKTEIVGWGEDVRAVLTSVASGTGDLLGVFHSLPDWMKDASGMGLIGGMLFGPKGAAVLALLGVAVENVQNISEELSLIATGEMSWVEHLTSPYGNSRAKEIIARRGTLEGLEEERSRYVHKRKSSYYTKDQEFYDGKIAEVTKKIDALKIKLEAQRLELASRQFANSAPLVKPTTKTAAGGKTSPKGTKADPITVNLSGTETLWSKLGIDKNSSYAYDLNNMDSYYSDRDEAMDRAFELAAKRQARAMAKAHKSAAKDAEKAWQESTGSMQKASESVASTVGDAMGEMASGAEVNFENMANAIIRSLMRIYVTQPLIDGLGGIFDTFSKSFIGGSNVGGAIGSSTGTGGGYNMGNGVVTGLHTGGLVGQSATFTRSVPHSLFSGADRYHSGGTILRPGEVPIIAEVGERVLTREQNAGYERMRNTPSAAPQININITNEDGTKSEVTNEESFFDGERWVCDMWMRGYKNNTNGMRDNLGGKR